jgi:hypothetical protein
VKKTRSNKPLYQYVFHGKGLFTNPEDSEDLESIGLDASCDWNTYQSGEIITEGSTSCYKIPLPNSNQHLFFKRYSVDGEPWRFFLRRSKAACETINYQRLNDLGIPTLDVVACYEQRTLGRLDWACIVTREITDSHQLDQFIQKIWPSMPAPEQRRVFDSIKGQLFEQLRMAHAARFFHFDLKWRNVLIQKTPTGYRPVWIDCPRGRFQRVQWRRGIVADLSALARLAISHFSRTQQMRFIYDYLGKDANRRTAHRLFRAVQRHLGRRPPRALQQADSN